ncbi:Beta-diguetoxin-Dc1a [Frankliniella fusca]|uniref:Beta-diguetoxin-Dc1a n=1 Tax=Frankliniella fusca TaxID=407009 RepID=A0AAE1H1B8_9NEOP|nr:Beta-diguetoxin-Dc1a [Frankliniella fusca]
MLLLLLLLLLLGAAGARGGRRRGRVLLGLHLPAEAERAEAGDVDGPAGLHLGAAEARQELGVRPGQAFEQLLALRVRGGRLLLLDGGQDVLQQPLGQHLLVGDVHVPAAGRLDLQGVVALGALDRDGLDATAGARRLLRDDAVGVGVRVVGLLQLLLGVARTAAAAQGVELNGDGLVLRLCAVEAAVVARGVLLAVRRRRRVRVHQRGVVDGVRVGSGGRRRVVAGRRRRGGEAVVQGGRRRRQGLLEGQGAAVAVGGGQVEARVLLVLLLPEVVAQRRRDGEVLAAGERGAQAAEAVAEAGPGLLALVRGGRRGAVVLHGRRDVRVALVAVLRVLLVLHGLADGLDEAGRHGLAVQHGVLGLRERQAVRVAGHAHAGVALLVGGGRAVRLTRRRQV